MKTGWSGWLAGAASALVLLGVLVALLPAPRPEAAGQGQTGAAAAPDTAAQPESPAETATAPATSAATQTPPPAADTAPPAPLPAPSADPASEPARTPAPGTAPAPVQAQDPTSAPAADAAAAEATPPAPQVAATPAPALSAAGPGDQAAAPVGDTPPAPAQGEAPGPAPGADPAPVAEPAPPHDTLLEPAAVPASPPVAAAPGPSGAAADVAPPAPASDAAPAPDSPSAASADPAAPPDPAPMPGQAPVLEAGKVLPLTEGQSETLPGMGNLIDREPEAAARSLPQIGKTGGSATSDLPQIGAAPQADAAAAVPDKAAPATDAPPLQRFARPFTPLDPQKPRFVILLRDIGAAGMARADLLRLPFPVSIVLDPLAPDAAEVMADWRAAGQEVVMAANGLPQGADAADVAQTFQALEAALPQAVAVMDPTGSAFQNDRPLATLVVPEIAGQGRGLVTWNEGLDAADQIAARGGWPAVRIFRQVDGPGTAKDAIRRTLDRAAFKAAQDGAVVVLGDTSPETVAAILEWTIEGRASAVNLAPLSAVLTR